MTDDEGALGEPDNGSRALISAVRVLLDSDRVATEQEVLVTSIIECLAAGARSTEELVGDLGELWPGAALSTLKVEAALESARAAGLVAGTSVLVGSPGWALTTGGRAEIDLTSTWFEDARARLTTAVSDRATDDVGQPTVAQATLWTGIIIDVLVAGVHASQSAHSGAVRVSGSGDLMPVALNVEAMTRGLDDRALSPEVRDFLASCVIAAIDEGDVFGNEIMGCVATGCVLHAVVAGRTAADAAEVLGDMNASRAVLDTPLLIAMLGPAHEVARIEDLIGTARDAQLEVIVCEHSLDELSEVLDRVERDALPGLLAALAEGTSSRVYRTLVREQVLDLFLESAESGRCSDWQQFRRTAADLRATLAARGVTVRPHGNHDQSTVDSCLAALNAELDEHSSSRGRVPRQRDADSMAMVWRWRRRAAGGWPGGWIVTTDTHLSPAYASVAPEDLFPLAIAPAQLAALLLRSAAPPEIPALVAAAAGFVRQDTMFAIATRYPPTVALDLARALTSSGASDTDVRVAQLDFGNLLDRAAGHPSVTGERLAGEVQAKRARRMNAAVTEQQRTLHEQQEASASVAAAALAGETAAVTASKRSDERARRAEREADDLRGSVSYEREVARRRVIQAVLLTLGGVLAVILVWTQIWLWALGTVASLIWIRAKSASWTTDHKQSLLSMWVVAIPEVVGIVAFVVQHKL